MQAICTKAPAAIRVDLAAIFVSLELSFEMAGDIDFARWRRKNVQVCRCRR